MVSPIQGFQNHRMVQDIPTRKVTWRKKKKQDKNEQTKRSGIQQIKCHKGYSHFHKNVLVYSRLTSQRSVPCIRANGSALRGFAHTSVGKGQDWPIIAMNVTTSNATPRILARFSNLCIYIYICYIYIHISKKQNRILIMPEYHVQQPILGKRKSQWFQYWSWQKKTFSKKKKKRYC